MPLCVPVSQGPCHLCRQLLPLSHSGDSEVAGRVGMATRGLSSGVQQGEALEAFGVLKGSSKAASPRPRAAKRGHRGVPTGCLPIPLPLHAAWLAAPPGGSTPSSHTSCRLFPIPPGVCSSLLSSN